MEQGQFKGFQDIVIRDGLWSFKGETVWSGNLNELWKYVKLSIEKDEHKHQVSMECARDASTETERERCIEIVKSHIASTYPINCKGICEEISQKDDKTKCKGNKNNGKRI